MSYWFPPRNNSSRCHHDRLKQHALREETRTRRYEWFKVHRDAVSIAYLERQKLGIERCDEEAMFLLRYSDAIQDELEYGFRYEDDVGAVVFWCTHEGICGLIRDHGYKFMTEHDEKVIQHNRENKDCVGKRIHGFEDRWYTCNLAGGGVWEAKDCGRMLGSEKRMMPNEAACKTYIAARLRDYSDGDDAEQLNGEESAPVIVPSEDKKPVKEG